MVASWHFLRLGLKTKKANLDFPKIFDNPFQNILFPKFLECICCISSYLQNSELAQ